MGTSGFSARLLRASAAAVLLASGAAVLAHAAGGAPTAPPTTDDVAGSPLGLWSTRAGLAPQDKVEPRLLAVAEAGSAERMEWVVVKSTARLDLAAFGGSHQFAWPAGEQVAILRVPASAILKLAALPGVSAVESGDPAIVKERPSAPYGGPEPHAAPGAAPLKGGGAQPDGWFDALDGHAAREAWELGFRGDGVKVAVLDDPVDFGHPDLQGTWAVLPDDHPYGGWPQAFDPYSTYLYSLERVPGSTATPTKLGQASLIQTYQESAIEARSVVSETRPTACFQPLYLVTAVLPPLLAPEMCDFVVPESAAGMVRFGHHPDAFLRSLGAGEGRIGEWAGVLLVDAEEDGDFDTVYVDLDNDHDFSDEKPVTKESPLAWSDIDEDGFADRTGGLLTYISDGELPVPGAWVFGLDTEAATPAAGRMVNLHYAYGGHGTLCASNIVSQGRLGLPAGAELPFRDLDGSPEAMNLGMAPDGELVSVGSVYAGGRLMFDGAWRYAVFGHDKERHDDDIQVTSNSYGFSDVDNDGWDPDSRAIDYYVRTFSPSTSMLFSTGNGAPGYGTLAPPSPATGLGIAASTQMGSTGYDSITDTSQITFGDIIPFSNRGPGADGRNGPNVAADGAFAAGASPINGFENGTTAMGTWGGTSRSSPVAAGVMTLVYEAFEGKHGRWPTYDEARSILMSGARFAGYDTLTMGAGVVDAADAVRIAGGLHGVYALPSEWSAGGYRGERHEAGAKLVQPGTAATGTLALHNDGDEAVEVALHAKTLRRIGSYDASLAVDRTKETTVSGSAPQYAIPVDRERIPEGTELMVVRGVQPMEQFDINGDVVGDNGFTVAVYQHTDIDGDGKLFDDRNGNGLLDNLSKGDARVTVAWDDQAREHGALEGAITAAIPDAGMESDLGWFGRGCNDDPQPQSVDEKIALIERGLCTFVEKLTNAINAGAIGAIVFTDDRAWVTMGGDTTVTIPGVMIPRQPGLDVQAILESGTAVTAGIFPAAWPAKGLGVERIDYRASEIDEFEYMRFSQDGSSHNNWSVSVHHPLERWSDGIYLGVNHVQVSPTITVTDLTFRLDFYRWEDWPLLSLSESTVTVPAGGEATFEAAVTVPDDAAFGTHAGAIFADYGRGEGDEPVGGPGGYEIASQRVVIPVNANVAADYAWKGHTTLGGSEADDRDAPYNLGAVRGAFNWTWRPESGDWRFFFVDATKPPAGTYWLFRTMWDDDAMGKTDIDTRVLGPVVDRYSNPGDAGNDEEDRSDPAWYGAATLNTLARSPYLHMGGGRWPFNTSSGDHDDWLATAAGGGLHEVMLHNVMFSGSAIEIPFETTVSSLQLNGAPVMLFGDSCGMLTFTSQMPLPGLVARGFGMSEPEVFIDEAIVQDNPNDRTTASFKHTITLTTEAGRFDVTLRGEADDDLDLVLLRDNDGDGLFAYPAEMVAEGTSPESNETIALGGYPQAGAYQVWVHGWAVTGESTFDLTIDIVSGDSILVGDVPSEVKAGQPTEIEVCADVAAFDADATGPLSGLVAFGPAGAPSLIQVPVTWLRDQPRIYLPVGAANGVIVVPADPTAGPPIEPTDEPMQ